MISTSGLTWWMRFPTAVYMAAMSVRGLLPQVGVRTRQPTRVRRGSFMMSIAATSGLDAYRAAMSRQAAKNRSAGQRSLYHNPLPSSAEQLPVRKICPSLSRATKVPSAVVGHHTDTVPAASYTGLQFLVLPIVLVRKLMLYVLPLLPAKDPLEFFEIPGR